MLSVTEKQKAIQKNGNILDSLSLLDKRRFVIKRLIPESSLLPSFFQVKRVLKLLENPYSDDIDVELHQEAKKETDSRGASEASCSVEEHFSYDSKPPDWAVDLRVT